MCRKFDLVFYYKNPHGFRFYHARLMQDQTGEGRIRTTETKAMPSVATLLPQVTTFKPFVSRIDAGENAPWPMIEPSHLPALGGLKRAPGFRSLRITNKTVEIAPAAT